MRRRHVRSGWAATEALIAAGLGLVVLMMVGLGLSRSATTGAITLEVGEAQRQAQHTLAMMVRDIRSARAVEIPLAGERIDTDSLPSPPGPRGFPVREAGGRALPMDATGYRPPEDYRPPLLVEGRYFGFEAPGAGSEVADIVRYLGMASQDIPRIVVNLADANADPGAVIAALPGAPAALVEVIVITRDGEVRDWVRKKP